MTVAHVYTVAFAGVDAREVDVQVRMSGGNVGITIVGLPDKAVAESRERVRAALGAIGLSLPPKRITVNLAPADLPKEGSHYDLPIALALLTAMGVLPAEEMANFTSLGELSLDGALTVVAGVLPATIAANSAGRGLICPEASGPEAAWAGGDVNVLAPASLIALVNHFKGSQVLTPPDPSPVTDETAVPDLKDIKGQEMAKRALEVAAAGGHNLLMSGPPGAGKSMLAARLPGILPKMTAGEALEVGMIRSVAGEPPERIIGRVRPFRSPHHSASMAALTGGGRLARPGEVSLAHLGVLFLDELPEFPRQVLDALRQPLETGEIAIARAQMHVRYPSRVQLVAAMNPCRCGYLGDPARACSRAPKCAADYQARISGPLLDRIDLHIDVPPVSAADLTLPPPAEGTVEVAARVAKARERQRARFRTLGVKLRINAEAEGELLDRIASPDTAGRKLLQDASDAMGLTARGYHRVLKVARTLADLEGAESVARLHVAEALAFRQIAHARG